MNTLEELNKKFAELDRKEFGQVLFNNVVERLNDGTGQAKFGPFCEYKTKDGLRCAVGIFLPDEEVMYGFIGGVKELTLKFENTPEFPPFIKEHQSLLSKLQQAHDFDRGWYGNNFIGTSDLFKIAQEFGLEYNDE